MKTTIAIFSIALVTAACSDAVPQPDPVGSILATDIQQYVDRLAGEEFAGRGAGTEGERLAGEYVAGLFADFGLEGGGVGGSFFQDFPIADGNSRNVVGVLRGSDAQLAQEWIVIGAHYDALGEGEAGAYFPGADDDASGTSVMLEVAQALALLEQRPARSILFIAFGAEERGLVGSKYYADHPLQPLDKTVVMINLEMMGRGDPNSLTVMLLEEMAPHLSTAAREAAADTGVQLVDGEDAHLRSGDQYPFHAAGVPILCFYGGEDHPNYHQVTDTADTIQSGWMESAGRVVYRTVNTIANPAGR